MFHVFFYLARSANLPEGLYILLALISSFFNLRQIISGSTGPIFTIIHQMKGICVNFLDPDLLFDSFRGVAMATDFVKNLQSDLYSTCRYFTTDSNIAILPSR